MFRKLILPMLLLACVGLTGCTSTRYTYNRWADFTDLIQIGGGITAENPKTGMLPPSIGLHVQVTEFLNLGAVTFTGLGTEWDGRGMYSGFETRTRIGLGPWQRELLDQDYATGSENYFKMAGTLWSDRMNSPRMRFGRNPGKPAKDLHYEALLTHREGAPVMHRGWQYWENTGIELSICDILFTHFGFNFRLGFDISEISDLMLGFFCLDYKHDDLTPDEYLEATGNKSRWDYKPASDEAKNLVTSNSAAMRPEMAGMRDIPEMLVIYFDYDKSNLRGDQMPRAEKDLRFLQDNPAMNVVIEGHCDERGTIEYNYALGERRAQTVRDYLIANGIAASRIRTISKGEVEPVDTGHNENAWSKNRRDEFKEPILKK